MKTNEYQLVGVTNDLNQVTEVEDIADYVEFRISKARDALTQLSNYDGDVPIIVSNHPGSGTGGTLYSDQIDTLLSAASIEAVEMVELGIETVRENEEILKEFDSRGVKSIISYYNSEETPKEEDLQQIISDCNDYGNFVKVVVFAKDQKDTLSLLQCLNTASNQGIDIAGYSLGGVGEHTRVISTFYGAKMAYAPIDANSEDSDTNEVDLRKLENLLDTIINAESVELMDKLKGKSQTV